MSNLSSPLVLSVSWSSKAFSRSLGLINTNTLVVGLRLVALVVSLLNVKLLSNRRFGDSIYKYLTAMAAVDALYSSLLLVLGGTARLCFEIRPDLCNPNMIFVYQVLFIGISSYFTSCLAIFNVVLEIFLTIQRITIIANVKSTLRTVGERTVCVAIFALVFTMYSPVLFMNKIVEVRNANSSIRLVDYRVAKTEFGAARTAHFILTGLTATRIILVTVVLSMVNVVAIAQYRKFLQRKRRLKRTETTSTWKMSAVSGKSVSSMLIVMAFLYIFGNLPYSIYNVRKEVFGVRPDDMMNLYIVSQFSLNALIIMKLVVYVVFNRQFRKQVVENLRRTSRSAAGAGFYPRHANKIEKSDLISLK